MMHELMSALTTGCRCCIWSHALHAWMRCDGRVEHKLGTKCSAHVSHGDWLGFELVNQFISGSWVWLLLACLLALAAFWIAMHDCQLLGCVSCMLGWVVYMVAEQSCWELVDLSCSWLHGLFPASDLMWSLMSTCDTVTWCVFASCWGSAQWVINSTGPGEVVEYVWLLIMAGSRRSSWLYGGLHEVHNSERVGSWEVGTSSCCVSKILND